MSSMVSKVVGKALGLGKQPAQLQLATRRDIPDMLRLFYKEGWVDYSHDDFSFLLETSAKSCFKLTLNDELVGVSIATLAGNGICYPHSNLIYTEYRDKINYFDEAAKYSEYLKQIAPLHVAYAAKRVVRLYQSGGGFIPMTAYRRVTLKQALPGTDSSAVFEVQPEQWSAVYDYTRDIYKTSRELLFTHFMSLGARAMAIADSSGAVVAFGMVRDLPKARALGPVIAQTPALARQLIAFALQHAGEAGLILEGEEKKLASTLQGYFEFSWEDNVMMKMYRGDASLLEDEQRLFGIFSRYIS